MDALITCLLCGAKRAKIHGRHLSLVHQMSSSAYLARFPGAPLQSAQYHAKMLAGNLGKVRTTEIRAKASAARKGISHMPHSAETKARIAAKAKERWANLQFKEKATAAFRAASATYRQTLSAEQKEAKRLHWVAVGRSWKGKKRSIENCIAIGNAHRGKVVSTQTKQKQSEARARGIIEGRIHPENNWSIKKPKTGMLFSIKNGCEIFYGSSYEKIAFMLLEQLSTVAQYSRCHFSILYADPSGKIRRYIPDIIVTYVDASCDVIEIKPKYAMDDAFVLAKAEAARRYCADRGMRYQVWTEAELGLTS